MKKNILLPKYQQILEQTGENIKLARLRRKLTLEQVAERSGMHRTTLYKIEKGYSSISVGNILNVLRVLNLHTDFLFIAKDDVFGRKLQDLELLTKDTSKTKKLDYELRNQLTVAIKRGYFTKNKLHNVIGCEFENLISHLENNKYGFKVGDLNIDVDHIIPVDKATNKTDIKKLYHYTNLQLLPSYYNRNIKSNKDWNEKDFDNWMKTF